MFAVSTTNVAVQPTVTLASVGNVIAVADVEFNVNNLPESLCNITVQFHPSATSPGAGYVISVVAAGKNINVFPESDSKQV